MELIRATSNIRYDFVQLAKSQNEDLKEYYRKKIEETRQIVQDDEYKPVLVNDHETTEQSLHSPSLENIQEEYRKLQVENTQLQVQVDDMSNDLLGIQNEYKHQAQRLDQQFNQIRQEIDNQQAIIDNTLENNVSLRFELLTYRRLLTSEVQHLNWLEQEQQLENLSSSSVLSSNKNQNHIISSDSGNYSIDPIDVKTVAKGK